MYRRFEHYAHNLYTNTEMGFTQIRLLLNYNSIIILIINKSIIKINLYHQESHKDIDATTYRSGDICWSI